MASSEYSHYFERDMSEEKVEDYDFIEVLLDDIYSHFIYQEICPEDLL